jgi:lipopolysaccharide biosynthesis regulator YciM
MGMNQKNLDAKIAEAWKAHYARQHQVAVEKFQALVAEAPDNIDANWGLGLSYRGIGDKENALQVFQKVKALVAEQLESDSEERERYFMLSRMVTQQIEQMSTFIPQA